MGAKHSIAALVLLVAVAFFNFLDRQVLSVLAEDIKRDLSLADGDLGFLYGTAFAVFYAVFGIPLARVADSSNRIVLIAVGLAFWSAMTASSSLSTSFLMLAILRFGVGAGEACATPSAYSLIYDYFGPKFRTTALAIYGAGTYLGVGAGIAIGGIVLDAWPDLSNRLLGGAGRHWEAWRAAFLLVGLPGLLLSLLFLVLEEPRARDQSRESRSRIHALRHAIGTFASEFSTMVPGLNSWLIYKSTGAIAGRRSILLLAAFLVVAIGLIAFAEGQRLQALAIVAGLYCVAAWLHSAWTKHPVQLGSILGNGRVVQLYAYSALQMIAIMAFMFWTVPLLQRKFSVSVDQVALFVGILSGLGGLVGMLGGGALADYRIRRSAGGKLEACLVGTVGVSVACLLLLGSSNLIVAYIAIFLLFMASAGIVAPCGSAILDEVVPGARALATAFNTMCVTFFGTALGPYLVGVGSDLGGNAMGLSADASLTLALSIVLLPQIGGAVLLVRLLFVEGRAVDPTGNARN